MVELLALVACGVAAGVFGALLGLGGGVLIVPMLTLGFGLPLREAVGASLVCVIVTSSAAASVYLERDVANLRLGMVLEMFTAIAALLGGLAAFLIPDRVLGVMFAGLLLYVSATMYRNREREPRVPASGAIAGAAEAPNAGPATPAPQPVQAPERKRGFVESMSGPGYQIRRVRAGVVGSLAAGVVSALFGVGGGIVKVPVMNLVMGVPLRVATATSNLMIGVTASAGGLVYLLRGGIDPFVAAPTAFGVFAGASLASRLAHRVDLRLLRLLFVAVLVLTAVQILLRSVT